MSSNFDDLSHGLRGGGDLHAVGTQYQAGFLSPEGHRELNDISSKKPEIFKLDWTFTTAKNLIVIPHTLSGDPDFVQVFFREDSMPGGMDALVTPVFDRRSLVFCGYTLTYNSEALYVATGDNVWGGNDVSRVANFSKWIL
ncbi:MAG: hypothetical protein LRZ84_14515 [Desertifilum sp.]|nr:hypothetical protein [Desertifilum sp.]